MSDTYVKIIRFSNKGFTSEYQSHHIKHMEYILNRTQWEKDFSHYPYMIRHMEKQMKSIDYNFGYGVFAFQYGYEDPFYLNHLSRNCLKNLECYAAKIPLDSVVYLDDGFPFLETNRTTPKNACPAMYIPSTSISDIFDVQKISNTMETILHATT